jgi:hypothetical protein
MTQPLTEQSPGTDGKVPLAPAQPDAIEVTADDFRRGFGEDLQDALDLTTWLPGDLSREYSRIEREVREAVRDERDIHRRTRERIFPLLNDPARAPKGGGVFAARRELLARIHAGLLFSGAVEACDGTVEIHDTLPLTIYQIGVSLVSYRGNQGTWFQRLFRRDLHQRGGDPVAEVEEVLRRRAQRGALNRPTPQDALGEMAQRAIMTYAERALLLRHSQARWLMGHGNPVPYELLTGGGCLELMHEGTKVLRELVEQRQKFVFVASEPRERLLLTIGNALPPMHYAVVSTLRDRLEQWVRQSRFTVDAGARLDWDGEPLRPDQWIPRFIDQVGGQVVIGMFRASRVAPAQVFYAHADHSDLAAHIALADSMLQEHRGFPLLIDLAHHVCRGVFGGSLRALTGTAYAAAGAPWRYDSERTTRDH